MQKPFALKPGDKIGIVAPSSPVVEEELKRGLAVLEARGYRPVLADNLLAKADFCNYLAGSDALRAADLNSMLARDDLAAIFCARGGYGAMRLFDMVDWSLLAKHPKIFLGYSDITSMHLALAKEAETVTFHGKMVCGLDVMSETAMQVYWSLLENAEPFGILPADTEAMQTLVPGAVEGELAGGCLTLLSHACGTRFAPDFRGKIVLIEDVGIPVYYADRYLTHLLQAGVLQQAAGFVVGTLTRWQEHEGDPPRNLPEDFWKAFFTPLGKPALTGFPFGHEPDPLLLPLGVRARLDAKQKTLTLLEAATEKTGIRG